MKKGNLRFPARLKSLKIVPGKVNIAKVKKMPGNGWKKNAGFFPEKVIFVSNAMNKFCVTSPTSKPKK